MKALSIAETCKKIGVGRTLIYQLIEQGRLDARKLGNRTVILEDSADKLLDSLPRMGAEPSKAA